MAAGAGVPVYMSIGDRERYEVGRLHVADDNEDPRPAAARLRGALVRGLRDLADELEREG